MCKETEPSSIPANSEGRYHALLATWTEYASHGTIEDRLSRTANTMSNSLGILLDAIESNSNLPLSLIERDGNITWVNQCFIHVAGCLGGCTGKSLRKMIRPRIRGMRLEQILTGQDSVQFRSADDASFYIPEILESCDQGILVSFTRNSDSERVISQPVTPPVFNARRCRERLQSLERTLDHYRKAYELLADNISAVVVRYDTERRRIYVNHSFKEFHGVAGADVLGKTVIEAPSCDAEHMIDIDHRLKKVIAEKESFSVNRNYVDCNGRHIFANELILPEVDADHQTFGALLVATGKYEMTPAVKDYEDKRKFRNNFEDVEVGMALSEKSENSFRILTVNRAYGGLFGKPRFCFESKMSHEIPCQEIGEKLDHLRSLALSSDKAQKVIVTVEVNGDVRVIEANFVASTSVLQGDGHLVRKVIEVFRDITQENISQTRLGSLLNAFPDLAFGLSGSGKIDFVSPSVLTILGGSAKEYRGKDIGEILAPVIDGAENPFHGGRILKRASVEWVDTELPLLTATGRAQYEFRIIQCGGIHGDRDYLLIGRDVTRLRYAEKELLAANSQMQELSIIKELSIEEERKRIAYELHDELGQELTAILLTVSSINRCLSQENPEVQTHLSALSEIVTRSLHSVRRVVQALRPPALDLGLVPAVEWLVSNLINSSDIDCDLTVSPEKIILNSKQSLHIFRCIQESLTNIAKHSKATLAYVEIKVNSSEITVRIGDNGIGFDMNSVKSRNGLSSIKNRVKILGGELQMRSGIKKGTGLLIKLPLVVDSENGEI